MKNEVEILIESAEQQLASFLEEFKVLRSKYPEIQFGGMGCEDSFGDALAYIRIGSHNYREVTLD